ncbi:MAG: PH domain-containing protein [Clostridia bacterium]|nr:PH domain-containing protein [Clostridia bacterium]
MFNKPTRNHITIIFEQLGAAGVVVITFVFSALREQLVSSGGIKAVIRSLKYGILPQQGMAFFAVAAIAVVLLIWLIIRWYKTVFYIDDGYLVCQRRTLMKKASRLPFSSLATVNLERSVFERMVGTAKIKIDINSAATADKTDFTFVLSLAKAKEFERILLEAKNTVTTEKTEEETDIKETVYSFSNVQAVRHVLLSQPVVQLLFSAALLGISLFSQLQTADISVILPTVGFIVIAWIFGIIMKIFSACRFCVECDEKSIYISSGLLKVKKYSFERSKINALVVRRPLLARIAGLYSAEVAVIGFGNDKEETPQISLLVKKAELERILNLCVPDFKCSGEIIKADKKGLLPSVVRALFVSFLCAMPLWFLNPLLSAVAVVTGAALGVLGHNTKTVSSDENIFSFSTGILLKKTAFFKYSDIQTVHFSTNAISKIHGIGRISLSILSSNTMRVHTTGWFKKETFEELKDRIM